MSEVDPLPETPASYQLTVELVIEKDSTSERIAREVLLSILDEWISPSSLSGARARVVVRDRWSGEPVYEQDYKHDLAAAEEGKKMIENDLEHFDLEGFFSEYSIHRPTPEQET